MATIDDLKIDFDTKEANALSAKDSAEQALIDATQAKSLLIEEAIKQSADFVVVDLPGVAPGTVLTKMGDIYMSNGKFWCSEAFVRTNTDSVKVA